MPIPLADLAALASADSGSILAVVSRDGTARDAPVHRHAPGQLLGSAEGLVSVSTEGGRFVLPATHAIWLPPRCAHAMATHGPFSGWSLYVADAACGPLPERPRILRVSGLLRAIVERAAGWGGPPRTPAEARLAGVAIDEITASPEEPLGLPLPRDPRLRRVADALLADLSDARGLEVWAAWALVPARTLARRFPAETGFTFAAWRRRARVLAAVERLARGEHVTAVALDLGYDSVSAFIAMFRRVTGSTPGRYGPGLPPKAAVKVNGGW